MTIFPNYSKQHLPFQIPSREGSQGTKTKCFLMHCIQSFQNHPKRGQCPLHRDKYLGSLRNAMMCPGSQWGTTHPSGHLTDMTLPAAALMKGQKGAVTRSRTLLGPPGPCDCAHL